MKKIYYIAIFTCLLAFLGALYLWNASIEKEKACAIEIGDEAVDGAQDNDGITQIAVQEICAPSNGSSHEAGHCVDSFNPNDALEKVAKEMKKLNNVSQRFYELSGLYRVMEGIMKKDVNNPVMRSFYLLVGWDSEETSAFPRTRGFTKLSDALLILAPKPELTDKDIETIIHLVESALSLLKEENEDELTEHVNYIKF